MCPRRRAPWRPPSSGRRCTGAPPCPSQPAVAYQVPERQGELVVVDEAFVEAAHRGGKAVHVWTVNEPEAMERLVGLGVDGIISDVPTVLGGVLAGAGANVAWNGDRAS